MSPPHLPDTLALLGADQSPSLGSALVDFLGEFWPILVPVVLGLAGVFLLLPRVRRYPPLWGALIGAVALIGAGWSLIHTEPDLAETILFYAFSAVAIVGGVLLITQRNPVRAALSFALVVLSTCGLFLLQAAPFLMAATIIIYAGAIIVTFLFVLMLAQQAGVSDADQRSREPLLATVAGFVLLGGVLCVLHRNYNTEPLDELAERARRASQARSVEDMQEVLGDAAEFRKQFQEQLTRGRSARIRLSDRRELVAAVDDVEQAMTMTEKNMPLEDRAQKLRALNDLWQRLRPFHGSLQLSGVNQPHQQLSGFSGLRPNVPVKDIPTDRQGRPVMPQQNVAALGLSLFTDYLLAVELAGTLLLVATIGAIAIAGRRAEGLR